MLNKVSANAYKVTIGKNEFFYSYETLIALRTANGVEVREANRWSRTTARHFVQLGCREFTIITEGEFDKIVKSVNILV